MVVLNRIYTRTGDDGTTALGTGERRKKYDLRIATYGTIDELNAAIGLARLATADDAALDAMLSRIQNDLFDVGADLCRPQPTSEKPGDKLRVRPEQSKRLEDTIDQLNERLAPLTSFVLPGGRTTAGWCHLARTVCRRAERAVVTLARTETINAEVVIYLNRLSDLLFVLARVLNDDGKSDLLWVPGKTQGKTN